MLNINGLTIEVSQGDFLPVKFNLEGYILREGDVVTLAFITKPPLRYQKTAPGQDFVIFEFPTNLPVGEYPYDISIEFADKKVRTLNWLRQGNFIVRRIAR